MRELYLIFVFSGILLLNAFSQASPKLQDYTYISINPKIYSNVNFEERFSDEMIVSYLESFFSTNGYKVLEYETDKWTEENSQNTCKTLKCYVQYVDYSNGKGKSEISLHDCKGRVIYSNSFKSKVQFLSCEPLKLIDNLHGRNRILKVGLNFSRKVPQYTKIFFE